VKDKSKNLHLFTCSNVNEIICDRYFGGHLRNSDNLQIVNETANTMASTSLDYLKFFDVCDPLYTTSE
jgi:hypothetical protein